VFQLHSILYVGGARRSSCRPTGNLSTCRSGRYGPAPSAARLPDRDSRTQFEATPRSPLAQREIFCPKSSTLRSRWRESVDRVKSYCPAVIDRSVRVFARPASLAAVQRRWRLPCKPAQPSIVPRTIAMARRLFVVNSLHELPLTESGPTTCPCASENFFLFIQQPCTPRSV